MNEAYEKLGLFYLGKEYDADKQAITENLTLYESKDLVTHGVCMGMTGSGKTGLCISLLEEAAIDNVPVIIVDPKGDLTNLFLTFPDLAPSDFQPWVNPDEASQKNITVETLAQNTAEMWKNGLAEWGQTPDRIKMFADSTERVLYTPGSTSGRPISILKSFDRPKDMNDLEAVGDRISTFVSGLLGLLDIDADPLTSKDHILISNIIQTEWMAGKDVAIERLIALVQDPPMARIGAFDIEAYYPKKDRFDLAMVINNLLASPQFAVWTKGESINIDNLLYNESGKPRMSVISIAHLSDQERMFFVTLLLNELVSWMRTQSGTGSLRALFYMDEIFGYLPPVANPPSKKLFLTLLKQARAFGIGLLLATQNPGDLDYKALSNVGTWFIGRLQTERDKDKVLEGLVTANSGADKSELSKQLSGLGKRVFMLNNTSDSHPFLFNTRWALSYLAGPIMKSRFKELAGDQADTPSNAPASTAAAATAAAPSNVGTRPVLDPSIPQVFIPGQGQVYQATALGCADVLYKDSKLNISETRQHMFVAPVSEYVDWSVGEAIEYTLDELEDAPRDGFKFANIEASISASSLKAWENDFKTWLYSGKPLEAFTCQTLDAVSQTGEDERAFRIRISQESREKRDEFLAKIRDDYAKEIESLQKARVRADAKAATQQSQASTKAVSTAISIGTSILGSLFGSRRSYSGIATQASRIGTTMKERGEAAAAVKSLEEIDQKLVDIEAEIQAKLESYQNADSIEIESVQITPNKSDINVRRVALSWKPDASA